MVMQDKSGKKAGINQDRNGELDARLARLSQALEKERRQSDAESRPHRPKRNDYGQALRLSSEFAAAILVGVILGWGLDRLAGTSPWGLIVFVLLGFVAGILNVIRASGSMKTSDHSDTEQ